MATDYHAKGQKDFQQKRGYNPPHGLAEDLLTFGRSNREKMIADNRAYREGWQNAKRLAKKR